jgi:imidazolonepropionase
MKVDCLLSNANIATMADDGNAPTPSFGILANAAIAISAGRIACIGDGAKLSAELDAAEVIDLGGRWVTPGLIDCHTHLVYGGNRADEWQARLEGASYAEIAAKGGGIAATVAATRKASHAELMASAARRLGNWLAEGVTTIEIKSGYGLNLDDEVKMLEVARQLGALTPIRVQTTFLGAHAIAPEFSGRADAYIEYLIDRVLPEVAARKLADAADAFCETIAFSAPQCMRLLQAAKALGLGIKIHADQLTDGGGAVLAASLGALSADHLEYTGDAGARALAASLGVAVLLPGAFYALRETQLPPLSALRMHGVPIAIATDHNPGTSPCLSLLLMLNMACTLFRMTPAEALLGVTRNAALALGIERETGTLAPGQSADIAIWNVDHVRDLCYAFGSRPLYASMYRGAWVAGAPANDERS